VLCRLLQLLPCEASTPALCRLLQVFLDYFRAPFMKAMGEMRNDLVRPASCQAYFRVLFQFAL
jgi:hypothetical protein